MEPETSNAGPGQASRQLGGQSGGVVYITGRPPRLPGSVPASLNQPPIPPVEFMQRILAVHEYDAVPIDALKSPIYRTKPTPDQIAAYDMDLVRSVRSGQLERIVEIHSAGKNLDACNRFGESILHMACRRGNREILQFLLDCGLVVERSDDFGRTPFHDACWTPSPSLEVATMLLENNRYLVNIQDSRKSLPLNYVHEEHFGIWCDFLNRQKDVWWNKERAADWNTHMQKARGSSV